MNARIAPVFSSIRLFLLNEIRRVLFRFSGVVAALVIVLIAGYQYVNFESKLKIVRDGIQNNLAYSIQIGDQFQIQRQIGSLVASSHFSGIWVFETMHGTLIAQAGQALLPRLTSTVPLSFQNGTVLMTRQFPIFDPNGRSVGRIILASPLPVIEMLAILLTATGILVAISCLLYRRFHEVAESVVTPITRFSDYLVKLSPDRMGEELGEEDLKYSEIIESYRVFGNLWERNQKYQSEVIEHQKIKASSLLAEQVIHDIRSPLTSLYSAVDDDGCSEEQRRTLIREAVNRIKDIANDLVEKRTLAGDGKSIVSGPERPLVVSLLAGLIDELVSEKRAQYRTKLSVNIEGLFPKESYGLFAKVQPMTFKRALSNLVDNAVESLDDNGKVEVTLFSHESDIEITVTDTGRGIPRNLLPNLTEREVSYKENGTGLGLFQVRESVEKWNGELRIESEVGVGTSVTILLPRAATPKWFQTEIVLTPQSEIIILDDDASIHQFWQHRLGVFADHYRMLHNFSKPEDLEKWLQAQRHDAETVFLIDYELRGSAQNGLDVIEKTGIEERSILVTSRYEESDVRFRADRLGVPIIPKAMAMMVPIITATRKGGTHAAKVS